MFRRIDDDMRAAMAIDWIAREKENPGRNYCTMIFQSDWEPVLMQRLVFGFEAILENPFNSIVREMVVDDWL